MGIVPSERVPSPDVLLNALQLKVNLNETDEERMIRMQMEALAADEMARQRQVRACKSQCSWPMLLFAPPCWQGCHTPSAGTAPPVSIMKALNC